MELKTDITILIIEGDEVDMMDFQRSIKKLNISNSVFCAANGVEGLMYLRGEDGKPKIEQPCVILLDLHKAKMNGFEFLDVLRKDAELKDTTVFILTNSNIEKDKAKAEYYSVAGFLDKSELGESFASVIENLTAYWHSMHLEKCVSGCLD